MSELHNNGGDPGQFAPGQNRDVQYALFSTFGGKLDSIYGGSKGEAVGAALNTALRYDAIELLSNGYAVKETAQALISRYATGTDVWSENVRPLISRISERFAPAAGLVECV